MNFDPLLSLLDAAANDPILQFIAIIIGTFILEDAMTFLAAMQVAAGALPAWLALLALYLGIALGDVGLFGLGRLAATHPWARRYIGKRELDRARTWLNGRLMTAVISTRFLPGARLPTYTACGFLGVSFDRFVFSVIVGTILWTTLLFTVSIGFGLAVVSWFGEWRWPIGIAIALLLFILGRRLAAGRLSGKDDATRRE